MACGSSRTSGSLLGADHTHQTSEQCKHLYSHTEFAEGHLRHQARVQFDVA